MNKFSGDLTYKKNTRDFNENHQYTADVIVERGKRLNGVRLAKWNVSFDFVSIFYFICHHGMR